jgi:transposase
MGRNKCLFEISYIKGRRPLKHSKREILSAILYVLRTDCTWRDLTGDFPYWEAVYKQLQRWKNQRLFEKLNLILRKKLRVLIWKRGRFRYCR